MRVPLPRLAFAASTLVLCAACTPSQTSADAPAPVESTPRQAQVIDCYRENGFTALAAHRAGYADGFAENALSSIRRSAELGALYAEVDVAQSTDGVLYLMHDRTLDRTTNGSGSVAETAWSDIEGLQLVDPNGALLDETVPTLADTFTTARDAGIFLNLDLKNVDRPTLVAAIEEAGAEDEVIVIAYTVEHAAELHALNPDLVLSAPNNPEALTEAGVNLDNVYLWLGVGAPDASIDAALAERGIEAAAGLFPLENGDMAVYQSAAQAGLEILSINNVTTGSAALGGAEELTRQIEICYTPG